jgi:pyrroline-5-carboxylate reductase
VSRIELVTVQNLLESTGKNLYVANENLINAGTAISGSGPAYVLYFMQAIMETGRELGFSVHQAEMLTYQTFKGIVEFFQSSKESCHEMIQKIASKGGTTEAALKMFEKEKVSLAINKAIKAANQRAIELGKEIK